MKLWKIVMVSGAILASGSVLAGEHEHGPSASTGENIIIYQDGYNNGADASQYGARGSITDVGQYGGLNYSKSVQSGDASLIKVRQYGVNNSSTAAQYADQSTINVEQHGLSNWAVSSQQ